MTYNKLSRYPVAPFSPRGEVPDNPAHATNDFPYYMGVELELERVRNPNHGVPAGWEQHVDQSLRNGVEYVTAGPMSGVNLKRAITTFYASGITWNNSPRASTHIHVNASDLSVDQLRVMFTLSYILEDALFQIIGAGRKFSGYCMPLFEMPPHRVKTILCSDNTGNFNAAMGGHNVEKYYGFNINSIRKHGTVEFRYFYGGPSKEELISWLSYCTSVKRAAKNISLVDLFAMPSPDALGTFITTFFGDWAARIIEVVGVQSLYDNLGNLSILFPDPERLVREDSLVFVSEDLLKAVQRCYFFQQPEKAAAFVDKARRLQVMSRDTWHILHREVRSMMPKMVPPKYGAGRAEMPMPPLADPPGLGELLQRHAEQLRAAQRIRPADPDRPVRAPRQYGV